MHVQFNTTSPDDRASVQRDPMLLREPQTIRIHARCANTDDDFMWDMSVEMAIRLVQGLSRELGSRSPL